MNPAVKERPQRRRFLQIAASVATFSLNMGAGLLFPVRALAARNKAAFEARSIAEALRQLGAGAPLESAKIAITAPDVAEDGLLVPIEVLSNIAGTKAISVLVEKNLSPLISTFRFAPGAEGFVSTRIKMGATSPVRVIVEAEGKFYTAAREVQVIAGGCGG